MTGDHDDARPDGGVSGSDDEAARGGPDGSDGSDAESERPTEPGDPASDDAEAPSDLAHELLARTRGDHLPPGARRRRPIGRGRFRPGDGPERRREGWSGAGPDALDPARVGSVIDGFVAARGWDQTMAQARVLSDWATIVGADVASHCSPVSLADGDLRLTAVSTAWATQLQMLEATMLARIGEQVGRDVVRRISVTGPVGPSWRHGFRTVPGARGPRDTYG